MINFVDAYKENWKNKKWTLKGGANWTKGKECNMILGLAVRTEHSSAKNGWMKVQQHKKE